MLYLVLYFNNWHKITSTKRHIYYIQYFCTAFCILLVNFAVLLRNLKFLTMKKPETGKMKTVTLLPWYSRFQKWLKIRNINKIATCEILQRQLGEILIYVIVLWKFSFRIFNDFSEIFIIFTEKKWRPKCKKFHRSQSWSDFIFKGSFAISNISVKKSSFSFFRLQAFSGSNYRF